jgi:hypothetical protein
MWISAQAFGNEICARNYRKPAVTEVSNAESRWHQPEKDGLEVKKSYDNTSNGRNEKVTV